MNRTDILNAAKGRFLKRSHLYVIDISGCNAKLLDKQPTSGNDLMIECVAKKEDIAYTETSNYKSFLNSLGNAHNVQKYAKEYNYQL